MKQCEACGDEFIPREDAQRFCTPSCSRGWFAAERRQAVEWFRAAGLRPHTDAEKQKA
jgi:hypothetical protein